MYTYVLYIWSLGFAPSPPDESLRVLVDLGARLIAEGVFSQLTDFTPRSEDVASCLDTSPSSPRFALSQILKNIRTLVWKTARSGTFIRTALPELNEVTTRHGPKAVEKSAHLSFASFV